MGYRLNLCHRMQLDEHPVCSARECDDPKFDASAASTSVADTLSVIFWVPVFDCVIVPIARKFTGHKNGLKRMGIGLFISIFAMIEFFYEQANDATRSMASAILLTTNALRNYLSTVLVTMVTDISTRNGKLGGIQDNLNFGHLQYFLLLAGLSVINLGVYLLIARWYSYKKAQGNWNSGSTFHSPFAEIVSRA
ncbi:hypothetical protein MLD38_025198 [Melastoma candidum]|uniref:Uncharacterized protein n=1 Tax=Melastoma candidum TaxID=119954 RepID=A0ACB9NZS3_9MYRT|nr:hypothetical protein MLD38_025198 [Melastoma candidum]